MDVFYLNRSCMMMPLQFVPTTSYFLRDNIVYHTRSGGVLTLSVNRRHALANDALTSTGSIMLSAMRRWGVNRCINLPVSPAHEYQTDSTARARSCTRDGRTTAVSVGSPTASAFGAGTTTRRYGEPLASTPSPFVGYRNGSRRKC